jgi:pimeloyl-ACP methyl ester carboxylesterase
MVDVGGHRLHINCTGTGSPTVVIDAGLGDWSTSWGFVQPEVAKVTRVCTYDRAGMGWSEPGPLPRVASQFAKELHALLHNAKIPGPYILVGHSLGGLPVRMFTHDYPSEVAGVVLIDSMHPGQSTYATDSARCVRRGYLQPAFALKLPIDIYRTLSAVKRGHQPPARAERAQRVGCMSYWAGLACLDFVGGRLRFK